MEFEPVHGEREIPSQSEFARPILLGEERGMFVGFVSLVGGATSWLAP